MKVKNSSSLSSNTMFAAARGDSGGESDVLRSEMLAFKVWVKYQDVQEERGVVGHMFICDSLGVQQVAVGLPLRRFREVFHCATTGSSVQCVSAQ